jgi:hypothetical protein
MVRVAGAADLPVISEIHDSYGIVYGSAPSGDNLSDWTYDNGVVLEISDCPAIKVSHIFGILCNKLIEFSGDATISAHLVDIEADTCVFGLFTDGGAPDDILVTNGRFGCEDTAFFWHPASGGELTVTGSKILGGKIADIDGASRVVYVGNISETGETFASPTSGFVADSVGELVITSNYFDGATNFSFLEIIDCNGGSISANTFDGGNGGADILLDGTTDDFNVIGNRSSRSIEDAFVDDASGSNNLWTANLGSDGRFDSDRFTGEVTIADDQVGTLYSDSSGRMVELTVTPNHAPSTGKFLIETTGTSEILPVAMGANVENGGTGSPSPGAGSDGKWTIYAGSGAVKISNRRGSTQTFHYTGVYVS